MSSITSRARSVKSSGSNRQGIKIRGGRIVQINRLKGRKLERGLCNAALRQGLSLDELHTALTRIVLISIHAGPPPVSEDYGQLVMAVHQESLAPPRPADL